MSKQVPEPELLLDYDEASKYLSATPRQLRRWVTEGKIAYIKQGQRCYWTVAMLDAWRASVTFTPSK